jgi:hypothetical protein
MTEDLNTDLDTSFGEDEIVDVDNIDEETDEGTDDTGAEGADDNVDTEKPGETKPETKPEGGAEQEQDYNAVYAKILNDLQSKMQAGQNQQTQNQNTQQYEMTPELARAIFEKELDDGVPPAVAIQNYVENASTAKLTGFQNQYGSVLNEQMLQKEISKIQSKYPDYKDYEADLKNIVENEIDKEYTDADRLSDAAAFEMAYLKKKVGSLEAKYKEAFENGKKQALQELKTQKGIQTPKAGAKNTAGGNEIPDGIKIVEQGDGIFL